MKMVKKNTRPIPDQLRTNSVTAPLAQNGEGLPEGWKRVKLGDVCKLKNGFAFKSTEYKNEGVPVIRISDINDGIVSSNDSVKVLPNEEYENYLVENDDILVAMSGATTGKFGIFKSKEKAYQNQRVGKFKILDEKILDKHFLYHQIHALKRQIEKDAYGGAQPNISSTRIEQMEVLLPPLNEQNAIVSKIEELLSELDKGKQQLETAQQQLKVYRQAVLKWAFEGKLTNENVKEGELPKAWNWKTLVEVCDMKAGFFVKASEISEVFQDGLFPCYGGNGLRGYVKSSTHEGMFPLIGRQGALCGNVHLVSGKFHATEHAVVVTPKEETEIKWLYHKLISMRLSQYSTGTAQPGLSVNKLFPIELTVPSGQEQRLIVQEIESRLSVCDKVEETITTSLAQAETLRQSILKKAFEGKLVSQLEAENIRALNTYTISNEVLGKAAESKVEYKKKKQILFPKAIDGISQTDLHAGILAMVIDAHEKSAKHHMKLSHVKGEKIAHLVEAHIGIDLGRTPKKDAAGPDDFPHLKKVESRAIKSNWFGVKKLKVGQTYFPKRGMPRIIAKVKETLPSEDLQRIENLLQSFLPFELEHAEVIATIFAAWNNLLLEHKNPKDEEIVFESRENWSKRKLGIERQMFFKTLKWMKEHEYVPKGIGKKVI